MKNVTVNETGFVNPTQHAQAQKGEQISPQQSECVVVAVFKIDKRLSNEDSPMPSAHDTPLKSNTYIDNIRVNNFIGRKYNTPFIKKDSSH